jgi:hypothetical protein
MANFGRAVSPSRLIRRLPSKFRPYAGALVSHYMTARRSFERRAERWRDRVLAWLTPPPPVPFVPFKDFIEAEHIALLELWRRQYLLEAIEEEWPKIVRNTSYLHWDDAVFRLILDLDNMNVVDLCSWFIGRSDSDGSLLLRVRNHYLDDFPPTRPRRGPARSDSYERMAEEEYKGIRLKLFPKADGRALVESDVDDLMRKFEKRFQRLRDDRNKNRAHQHEHKTHKTPGTAPMLSVKEMRSMYEDARALLNDLSVLGMGSSWGESDLNSNNVSFTAEDLLDVFFLPNWFRKEMAGVMRRDEIFDALHANPRPGPFNDGAKLRALANERGARWAQIGAGDHLDEDRDG